MTRISDDPRGEHPRTPAVYSGLIYVDTRSGLPRCSAPNGQAGFPLSQPNSSLRALPFVGQSKGATTCRVLLKAGINPEAPAMDALKSVTSNTSLFACLPLLVVDP